MSIRALWSLKLLRVLHTQGTQGTHRAASRRIVGPPFLSDPVWYPCASAQSRCRCGSGAVQADEARAHADDLKRHVARLEQVRTTDERASERAATLERRRCIGAWCTLHAAPGAGTLHFGTRSERASTPPYSRPSALGPARWTSGSERLPEPPHECRTRPARPVVRARTAQAPLQLHA